jgi:hypothetical protein
MTLCRAAASLAAPQAWRVVPVTILTPSRVTPVDLEAAAGGVASPTTKQLLAHHAAALVDEVADDLVALEVPLALGREVAGQRLQDSDLVLARSAGDDRGRRRQGRRRGGRSRGTAPDAAWLCLPESRIVPKERGETGSLRV